MKKIIDRFPLNVKIEDNPINFFIKSLRDLPDGLITAHGILIPFDEDDTETKFFNEIRKRYRAVADWLFYYFGQSSLATELTLTEKNLYKFDAERSKAWIDIIQETFILSPKLKETYQDYGFFWFLIEMEICENMLINSGFTGKPDPISKSKYYKGIQKVCDFLERSSNLSNSFTLTRSPTNFFCSLAMEICSHPDNQIYRGKWSKFLKEIKRCERLIRQSSSSVVFLKDGEIRHLSGGER